MKMLICIISFGMLIGVLYLAFMTLLNIAKEIDINKDNF